MGAFVVYILEWSACLLAFLLLYKMCFSGSTFHRFNRFYLLGTLVLSAILPLIHIAPTAQMEPMAEACRMVVPMDESMLSSLSISSALEAAAKPQPTEKVVLALLAAYMLYVLIQVIGWGKSIFKMLRFLHGKHRHRMGRWIRLMEHDAEYGPFSWMNYIVISTHEQGFGRKASVRHELSHIVLLHHLDLLMLMLCVVINPTCWIVMKELKIVHEYEADDEVINHYRIPNRDYQRLLIMRTVGAEAYALASSFNLNIKKRIIMMKKKQSHWWRIAWVAVTLPLIGFTLMAFSKPKEALREVVDNSVRIMEVSRAPLSSPEENTSAQESVKAPSGTAREAIAPDNKPANMFSGNVKDEKGQPLVGASVVEIDVDGRIVSSSVCDYNGNFMLKVVNPAHKFRISFVGYKSKTLDYSSSIMDVALEPATMINNIMVVGRRDSIDANSPRYQDQTNTSELGTFTLVEQAPSFPGGQGEIMKYLSSHLMYPAVAREMHVEAEILVSFTIDKTGFVRGPQASVATSQTPLFTKETEKAAQEGDNDALEVCRNFFDALEAMKEEAIHVVRNMPRWEPGRQNGKRIETTYTLPISFKLQ